MWKCCVDVTVRGRTVRVVFCGRGLAGESPSGYAVEEGCHWTVQRRCGMVMCEECCGRGVAELAAAAAVARMVHKKHSMTRSFSQLQVKPFI